jgi:malate dehydrogenase (oxaloacetate-decarboxylating)(NADP+)
MDDDKAVFAQKTECRTLREMIVGADVFLGLSAGGVLKVDMVKTMGPNPIIFALANPTPEILPEEVKAVRDDAIMATGRTDYPNQVNNVLCFPYIFRGALDAGASTITLEMEIAAVHAIADLAQAEQSDVVAAAYTGEQLAFGPEYLIPKPFDPRLMMKIAPAVAKAAADSGVALRPIADMDAYRERLQSFVYASGTTMKPIFTAARKALKKRVAYAEGEEERVLRAAQIVVDERLALPTLIGRPAVIAERIEKFGLRLKEGVDYQVVNVEQDHRYRDFWQTYHRMTERKGMTVQVAKIEMRRRLSLIGAMLLHKGDVDGLICGTWGRTTLHLEYVDQVIGKRVDPKAGTDCQIYACMNGLMLPGRQVFLVDTHVNYDPTAQELARITVMAAEEMVSNPRSLYSATPALVAAASPAPSRCATPWPCCKSRRPGSKWTARCTATRRWTVRHARPSCPIAPCKETPICWCCPISMPPTLPTTCSKPQRAATSPLARSCSVRPNRCTF